MNTSPIERLQLDIAARLDANFKYVTVYVIRPRSEAEAIMIQTNIEKALSGLIQKHGKAGATFMVGMPAAICPHQDSVGVQLDLLPMVRIIENPVINMGAMGTGMSCEEIMFEAMDLLDGFIDTGRTLVVAKRPYEQVLELLKEKNQVAYDLYFQRHQPRAIPCKTIVPKITGAADAVSITCATGGAAIYYTTDGSYPSPQNGAARVANGLLNEDGQQLFNEDGFPLLNDDAGPITTLTAGALLRAVAYAPNKQASNLASSILKNP